MMELLLSQDTLRPTDLTNKALINEKDKYFGSEPLKPTSLFL